MSNQGYHAADDSSLARSTGGAAARGAMLVALALVIGLILMAFALDDPQTDLSTASSADDTTESDDSTTDSDGADDGSDDTGVSVGEPVDDGTDGDPAATIPPTDDADVPDDPPETIPEETAAGELHDPSTVNVLVANGTGGKGVAGAVSDKLKAAAYIANISNAPSTAEAVIYYRVGYDADARAVADVLGSPPDIIKPAPGDGTIAVAPEAVTDGRLTSANVVVIIGADNNVPTG